MFTRPVSRLAAFVAYSFLSKSSAVVGGLGLDEVEYLSSGDWSCHVSKCSWWSLGVASVTCMWPLLPVEERPEGILCVGADVLVGQLF